jgi:glycosyltransferase involved in cell wall biosynthesis
MNPLISVVMPLFNAADTVFFALASLQAQTWGNWECIVVNDGSTDDSERVIQTVRDSRIHYHLLDRNRGRGYARQCGLRIAQGKYIAFLDADDWIYPDKLHKQAELLEAEPDLSIVSTGMAISNSKDELMGVRNTNSNSRILRADFGRIAMPPLAFAPSMIAADLAKTTGFDPSFPIAEDVDFLLRALPGRRYAILPSALYVYREHGSATPEKISSALHYCCSMFEKQFDRHPVASAIEIAKARGKHLFYHAASRLGLWDYVIRQRSESPSIADCQLYENAKQVVSEIALSHFALA